MKQARPVGAGRVDHPPLRLVREADASATQLLDQAHDAEARSRIDVARDLCERAIERAREPNESSVIAAALLTAARLASAAGDQAVALDILEAVSASAAARGSDG